MADAFSTVAAVVSLADVMIRACEGISNLVVSLKDAPDAAQHLRQTVQNVKSLLVNLQLYLSEYDSSNLSIGQHQFLPETMKKELSEIRKELDCLQQFLPPFGTQEKLGQRLKRVFDEKRIPRVVRRLESRQIALGTGLQIVAQRIGIRVYENVSNIRDDIQQSHMSTANRLLETQSAISQQLEAVARVESNSLTEQMNTLNEIRMLVEPIPGNHTMSMNKVDNLISILASMRMGDGQLQSSRALQAPTTDILRRVVRAELKRVVMPTVEGYLDSYKSSHDAQLEGIRRNLDQIVQDLGRSSQEEAMTNHTDSPHASAISLDEIEAQDARFLPLKSKTENMDDSFGAVGMQSLSDDSLVDSWNRSWTRSWVFSWRIGVLIVTVSTSHPRSRYRRNVCLAFKTFEPSSATHSYRMSINFQPAPSLLFTRGISMKCESRQDQRGYYQMCPMMTTFAIIPNDAEAFILIDAHDITGLQALFEARLAAPTDRNKDGISLLHFASFHGFSDVCESLLKEGADPSAIDNRGCGVIDIAQKKAFGYYSVPASYKLPGCDYYATTRALARAGCDLNDTWDCMLWLIPYPIEVWREPLWKNLQQSLLDWTTFWCDLGLNMDVWDVTDTELLINLLITAHRVFPHCKETIETLSNAVFLLCLLKADVSLRTVHGLQALHILTSYNAWSAEFSPHFIELAYILIHFGGADIFAVDDDDNSPTTLAFRHDWEDEWMIVLDRCGLNPLAVLQKEMDRWNKIKHLGNGESTAVDTEDLILQAPTAATRRRAVVGDRLDD